MDINESNYDEIFLTCYPQPPHPVTFKQTNLAAWQKNLERAQSEGMHIYTRDHDLNALVTLHLLCIMPGAVLRTDEGNPLETAEAAALEWLRNG